MPDRPTPGQSDPQGAGKRLQDHGHSDTRRISGEPNYIPERPTPGHSGITEITPGKQKGLPVENRQA